MILFFFCLIGNIFAALHKILKYVWCEFARLLVLVLRFFSNCASNERKEIKFCRMKCERDEVLQLIKITKILCLGELGRISFCRFSRMFRKGKKLDNVKEGWFSSLECAFISGRMKITLWNEINLINHLACWKVIESRQGL